MAVTPLAASPTLQVVEAGVTDSAVPARHMRQTLALPSHGVAVPLLLHRPIRVTTAVFAFVCWIGSQGISKKPILAAITIEAGSVIDALQALPRQAVAVPHCVGVDVVIALAQAAEPHGAIVTLGVSKVAVITELTSLTSGADWTVGAHHLLCLRDNSTT